MPSRNRDAAELPQASCRPADPSEIDTLEELMAEMVDRVLHAGVSFPMAREVFRRTVVNVCITGHRQAAKEGWLDELLGEKATHGSLEVVARLLAEIIDADNPRLHAKCIDFVLGFGLCQGKSETEIAEEEGVGKAAVSKRCKVLQKVFGVPPSRGMKREEACESYRQRQLGKRAKPRPQPWAFSGLLARAYGAS